MENWQNQHITRNKYELTRNTVVSEQLLLILESKSIFGLSDLESIRNKPEGLERSRAFYDLIQTRLDSYELLVQALIECSQTGASQLLIDGFTKDTLRNSKVALFGKTIPLEDVFDNHDLLSIRLYLKETHTVTEFQQLVSRNLPILDLLKNTIPRTVPSYIPRRIEKRTNVDPRLFQTKCEDVFVFQGLDFIKLNNIAPEPPNKSGRQLMKIDTRFIFLEFMEHWETLKQISEKPIHLIIYDDDKNTFTLQSTKGASKILRQFLCKPLDRNNDTNLSLSEREFTQLCLGLQVVCICDRPGMGKSYFLANMTRHAMVETNRVVAFIRLRSLMEFIDNNRNETLSKQWNVKQRLLSFLSTSNLAFAILDQFDRKHGIKLELFFDGFDEVKNVVQTTQFLSSLRGVKDCRIFVTSRPHLQDQLEDALNVLSFNLLPFNEDDQINYVVKLWKNWDNVTDTEKLVDFANVCLTQFRQQMSYGKEKITGIPLQCYLLADVYKVKARTYANTKNGFVLNEQIIVESQFDIFNLYIAERLMKENDFNKRQNIKSFHAWHAFKIVFPEIAQTYYEMKRLSTISNDYSEYLEYGFLEEYHDGTTLVYKFLHRTIAEFLVARSFGQFVLNELTNSGDVFVKDFVKFLYDEVFLNFYEKQLIFNDFYLKPLHHGYMERKIRRNYYIPIYSFKYNVVVYFLNFYLHSTRNVSFPKRFEDTLRNVTSKEFQIVCRLLKSCAFHNFSHIVSLIEVFLYAKNRWFSPLRFLISEKLARQNLLNILIIAAKYSDVPTIKIVVNVLGSYYCLPVNINVSDEFALTPVSVAMQRGNFPVFKYFLSLTVIHENICENFWKLNLRFCIAQTTLCSEDQVSEKKDILELVISVLAKSCLAPKKVNREVPPTLVTCGIDLVILKYLLGNGFDMFSVNNFGENILHQAANSIYPINAKEFHRLISFALSIPQTDRLFTCKNDKGKLPLFLAIENIKNLQVDTLKNLFDFDENDFENRNSKESLLFAAVRSSQSREVVEYLIHRCAYNVYENYQLSFGVNSSYETIYAQHLTQDFIDKLNFGETLSHLIKAGSKFIGYDKIGQFFTTISMKNHFTRTRFSNNDSLLHLFAQGSAKGFYEICQFFAYKGYTEAFNAKNLAGRTPFHEAVIRQNILEEAVLLLIENGVDLNSTDNEGKNIHRSAVDCRIDKNVLQLLESFDTESAES